MHQNIATNEKELLNKLIKVIYKDVLLVDSEIHNVFNINVNLQENPYEIFVRESQQQDAQDQIFTNRINSYISEVESAYVDGKISDLEDRVERFNTVLLNFPPDYRVLQKCGEFLYECNYVNESVKILSHANYLRKKEAEKFDRIGIKLHKTGNYLNAILAFKRALNHGDENPSLWKHLGYSYFKEGNWIEAINSYLKAAEYETVPFNKEFVKTELGRLRRVKRIAEICTKALGLEDMNLRSIIAEPDKFNKINRPKKPAQIARKIGIIRPGDITNYDDELRNYEEILKRDPTNEAAWYSKALILKERKDFINALSSINKAIDYSSTKELPLNTKGLILRELGDIDDAIVCYRKSIAINNEFFPAWNNLGVALHMQNKVDKAIKHYNHVVRRIDENVAESWFNLGIAYYHKKELGDSLSRFVTATDKNRNFAKAWHNRGFILRHSRDLIGAIKCYEKAIKCDSTYAKAINDLGVAYHLIEKNDMALELFRQAFQLNPNYETAWINLTIEERLVNKSKPTIFTHIPIHA